MKSWNYVLEFKCSQKVRNKHTRKKAKQFFKAQIQYSKPTTTHNTLVEFLKENENEMKSLSVHNFLSSKLNIL